MKESAAPSCCGLRIDPVFLVALFLCNGLFFCLWASFGTPPTGSLPIPTGEFVRNRSGEKDEIQLTFDVPESYRGFVLDGWPPEKTRSIERYVKPTETDKNFAKFYGDK